MRHVSLTVVHRVGHAVWYLTNPCELPSGFLVELVDKSVDEIGVQPTEALLPRNASPRRCLMKKSQMFRIAQIIGGVGAAVAVFAAPLKWW
jgi:hypothetical protein